MEMRGKGLVTVAAGIMVVCHKKTGIGLAHLCFYVLFLLTSGSLCGVMLNPCGKALSWPFQMLFPNLGYPWPPCRLTFAVC